MDLSKTGQSKTGKSALGSLLANKTSNFVPPVLHEVGKLAAGVASVHATGNSGSATGNPRNKCALQPGHSLMDWIRLGNSGKDLTGVGSDAGRLSVTLKELGTHDKQTDCWLAIRGRVYNVTAYLPFHPGGVDELMKGAGKDATTLFDQIHPWVNYDQILQKCLVGRLVALDPDVNVEELFFGNETKNKRSNSSASTEKTDIKEEQIEEEVEEESLPLPRFDWIQKMDSITITFYTTPFSNPSVEITPPNHENELKIILAYSRTVFTNDLTFFNSVEFPCKVKLFWETGKVEMVFRKSASVIWDSYGTLMQKSDKMNADGSEKVNYVIVSKQAVNHNIYLLNLERTDNHMFVTPVGKHVRVFAPNTDLGTISRSYTPVPDNLFDKANPRPHTTDKLCLMIKHYPKGVVSKYVTEKEKGDTLTVSSPLGNFNMKKMEKIDKYVLLAAGTGITPMLSLILFLLERRIRKCQLVALLLFNKTGQDIPFRGQLDQLSAKDKRLKVEYVLSEPEPDWEGSTGHVTQNMVCDIIDNNLQDTLFSYEDVYGCACGPDPFVAVAERILKETGLTKDHIHCFMG